MTILQTATNVSLIKVFLPFGLKILHLGISGQAHFTLKLLQMRSVTIPILSTEQTWNSEMCSAVQCSISNKKIKRLTTTCIHNTLVYLFIYFLDLELLSSFAQAGTSPVKR